MWPFKKKQVETKVQPVQNVVIKTPVEIVAHKNATKEQAREVREANEKLQKVFERNHFTVKLYVAAGHTAPKAKTTKGNL